MKPLDVVICEALDEVISDRFHCKAKPPRNNPSRNNSLYRSWQDLFCTLNQLNKVWHEWPGSNDFMGAPSNAIKSCWWWNWEASTLSALSGRKTMRSDTEPAEQGLAGVMVVLLQCS